MSDAVNDLELAAYQLGLRLAREAEAAAGPVLVSVAELPALTFLLAHHRKLIERENKRCADLRAAQRKAGRKRTDTPAASTLRVRASRARKRAGKEGASEPES